MLTNPNISNKNNNYKNQIYDEIKSVNTFRKPKNDPNKYNSLNSKKFTKITTSNTNKNANYNRGYYVTETKNVTRTTGNDGKTREYVEVRKEKYDDDPNLRDEVVNYEQGEEENEEEEEGFVYGQEDEEGEEN